MDTRLALAACLVLGSALCGKAAADAVRRRARTLEALAEGLRLLRIHMTGMLEPVRRALESSDCGLFSLIAEGMGDGRSAKEAWRAVRRQATRRGGPADAMTEADARILDGLFMRLGESGREEQEALLSASIRAVERQRDAARDKAAEADRLYASLGLLVGVMLALIVI